LNAVQAVQSAVNQMAYQAQQNAQHLSQKQQASLNDLAAAQQVTHSAPFFSNLALLSNIFLLTKDDDAPFVDFSLTKADVPLCH
jgi:hypothetical protein